MRSPLKAGHPADALVWAEAGRDKEKAIPYVRREEAVKLDAPWYSPSGKWSEKTKGATRSSDCPG